MAYSLEGKVVLITGAAGGFGAAMIRQFLQAGSRLVLADLAQDALSARVAGIVKAAQLEPRMGQILGYIGADLASDAGCAAVHAQTVAITPHIGMLVNNAGIAMSGHFTDMPQAQWEQLMAINLLAPMRLTYRFLPAMMARRSGYIVNISSLAGIAGTPMIVPYSTAKFGLRGFGEALANELAPYHINTTNLYPFFARTAILESPHYGAAPRTQLPDRILYSPDFVIEQLLRGIRRRRREVFPGAVPRVAYWLRRFAPFALPKMAA
ncbi:MAG: SDR family NAD(P)-dependent oxidoreductase [Ktedonobacterales bacterium]|nr:SDR family NAD(P)-dependent oxidoreductase [Ktedonobacterales bacterium]